jgi:hypothetical protein
MKISTLSIPVWAIVPLIFTLETPLCAVLGAALLDGLVRRPQVGGGIVSVALIPLTLLVGALAILGIQSVVAGHGAISAGQFPQIARSGVFVMLIMLAAGALSALTSLFLGERPGMVPALGVVANAVLVGLFWYFRFYSLGFDQDLWAPR